MRNVLTDKRVQNAQPPKTGRLELADALEPGLALRITSDDRRSWAVRLRCGTERVQRRVTLGHPRERDGSPVLSLAQARKAARKVKVAAAEGRPLTAADGRKGALTFGEVVEQYLVWVQRNRRPRSYRERVRVLRHADVATWKDRPAKSITAADVRELRDRITHRGAPVQATRTLSAVSAWGTWAVSEGKIEVAPAAGVLPITKEVARDRTLSTRETMAFMSACGALSYPFSGVCALLLLTAQRLNEVAGMEWSEVDFDARLWTIPASRTKNGREHHVHLSTPAIATLRGMIEQRRSRFVFTTTGEVPVSGFSRAKLRLDREMVRELGRPVEHFTLHDLRRSAATIMASLGVPPHVVEKILNHSGGVIGGIAKIYNRHSYAGECRDAIDKLAAYVSGSIFGSGRPVAVPAEPGRALPRRAMRRRALPALPCHS